jgi:hypothetical protein
MLHLVPCKILATKISYCTPLAPSLKRYEVISNRRRVRKKEVRVIHIIIHSSQYHSIGRLNSIGKTPERFYSLYYPQRKNPVKAFDNLFIMEEAVAGTTGDAPEYVINIANTDNVNNLIIYTDTDTDTNTY